jgi:regulator of sigma E protease
MIITILATLFVLGVLVLVHELGHFWMARKVGIRVLKFSFGFPPKLFGFKHGDTEYLVQAIPFGGYVKLAGEDAFEDDYQVKPGDYLAAPWWGRALMAFTGPAVNLVFAFVLMLAIGLTGIRVSDYAPVVAKVENKSRAEQSGVMPGDRIISINGKETASWRRIQALTDSLAGTSGDSLLLSVERSGQPTALKVVGGKHGQWYQGMEPAVQPELGEVALGMPAYQAGLNKGDLILEINGQPVSSWDGMRSIIYQNADKEVRLKVLRKNDTLNLVATPMEQSIPGYGKVGVIGVSPVEFGSYKLRLGPLDALSTAFINTVSMVGRTYGLLYSIITKPQNAKQLGGVMMIGQMAGQTARKGFSDLLTLMAVLSISLFVLNLLPLPIMDGGVIFFCLLEGIRKKPLPNKVQMVIQQIGLALIILLFAWTIVNDSMRIISRKTAIKSQEQKQEEAK